MDSPSASDPSSELTWSVLFDPPMTGARNMARDHALALGLGRGAAVLRLYRWTDPTISFGRNEPTGTFWARAASAGNVGFVRRPTGGRAVLHDGEITYAVVVPARALGGARNAYRRLNQGLVAALRSLGVPAEMATGSGEAARPDAGPCFQRAAPGEITVGGRKLVGSAQARIEGALLQHGSLLMEGSQDRLDTLGPTATGPNVGDVSLAELLGESPSWERLAHAITAGLAGALGGQWSRPNERTALWDQGVEADLSRRYRSASWTWRR